jgi:Domain of unknown function (DUF4157)
VLAALALLGVENSRLTVSGSLVPRSVRTSGSWALGNWCRREGLRLSPRPVTISTKMSRRTFAPPEKGPESPKAGDTTHQPKPAHPGPLHVARPTGLGLPPFLARRAGYGFEALQDRLRAASRMMSESQAAATGARTSQQADPDALGDHEPVASPVLQGKCVACATLEREAYWLPMSSSGPVVQRKCEACTKEEAATAERSARFGHDFSRIPIHSPERSKGGMVQPKLAIGQQGDRFEQEADRVAEAVMRMPGLALTSGEMASPPIPPFRIQRACAPGAKDEPLRRKADEGAAEQPSAPPIVHEVLRSSGRPIDDATRATFEPRLGFDFSKIRIYADERAAESARSVGALAYTVGPNVVFGRGQYQPHTEAGQKLLAHELAHVVQQQGGAERAGISGTTSPTIQRKEALTATTGWPTDPDAVRGIRPYMLVSSLPEAGHTPGSSRSFPRAGPYLLAPHLRSRSDGTTTIVYYAAFNTDKNHDRIEWIVGPDDLLAFQRDVDKFARAANMAYRLRQLATRAQGACRRDGDQEFEDCLSSNSHVRSLPRRRLALWRQEWR